MFGRKDTPAKSDKPVDVTDRPAGAKATAKATAKPRAKAAAKKAAPAKRAKADPTAPPKTDDPVVPAAFEQGRAARNAAISRDDAPHGDGEAKKQWLKGYDYNG